MKKEYRNSARTKKMIRAAFVELLGEKKGLSDISIAELSERADIAKSTFYNHYDDIYSVAEEMQDELIASLDRIIDAMEEANTADYRIYLMSIFEFLKQNEETYRTIIVSPDVRLFTDKIKHIISKRILSKDKLFSVKDSPSERYMRVRFVTNSCVDIMVDYFKGDIDMTMDQLAESVLGIIDKIMY